MLNPIHALADWHIPQLPAEFGTLSKLTAESASSLIRQGLAGDRKQKQIAAIQWLYRLVRSNVKRGRVFELDEVLATRRADCLGCGRLFSAVGLEFGLELGVVEVLIDNSGRYVPHHVNLVRLADGTYRFVDAWYGATDISHRRIGARVKGKPTDIDTAELSKIRDLEGLTEQCLDAITFYIKGNQQLQRNEFDKAIEYYSMAIELYPNNSRAFYNRALAYEGKGDARQASRDYAQALKDEASLIRVLATTCDLEELIRLDEKGVSEEEQDIYLWHKGFKTGETAGYEEIAGKYGILPEEAERIVLKVKARVQAD